MHFDQLAFSKAVQRYLLVSHPKLADGIKWMDDGTFDAHWRSSTGKFAMWVGTYNSEITFGLEDLEGNSDIHTHVSCYEEADLPETLATLGDYIQRVIQGEWILCWNSKTGYDWVDSNKLKKLESNPALTIRIFPWAPSPSISKKSDNLIS